MVSCCAQIATLPFIVYYFNSFSPYAPLFSLLYIPLTGILVISTFVLIAVAVVWTAGAVCMASALSWLVCLQLGVMRWQGSLPAAVVEVVPYHKAQPQLIVYNNRRCPSMHIIVSPSESYLIKPDDEQADDGLAGIRQTFWKRRLTAAPVMLHNAKTVRVYDKTVMMLRNSHTDVKMSQRDSSIDILWLCQGFNGTIHELGLWPRLVVLDASLPERIRDRILIEAEHIGVSCYDIRNQGALRLSLPF